MLRASVLFAENDGRVHVIYCSRAEGTLFADKRQVKEGSTTGVNSVDVRVTKGGRGSYN